VNQRCTPGTLFGLGSLAVDAVQIDLRQARSLARATNYAFDSRRQGTASAVRRAVSG
jgi:hypothetical protein